MLFPIKSPNVNKPIKQTAKTILPSEVNLYWVLLLVRVIK
jgi:hypothetical protein